MSNIKIDTSNRGTKWMPFQLLGVLTEIVTRLQDGKSTEEVSIAIASETGRSQPQGKAENTISALINHVIEYCKYEEEAFTRKSLVPIITSFLSTSYLDRFDLLDLLIKGMARNKLTK
jgi:hypothetical protein|tara:strand:+ start:799 stop:1152 length:354 start_codon:yes stop_codon:yes gene_type:complete